MTMSLMLGGGAASLWLVALFIFVLQHSCIDADYQVDVLTVFKKALTDPNDYLNGWDPSSNDPCSWLHVTCDPNNNVTRVDLGNMKLSGQLVPQLGSLKSLQYIEVYVNNLSGAIPVELGNLTNMISLDLYNNSFTGLIPRNLGNLSNLKNLRLDNNNFSGCVPLSLLNTIGRGGFVNINNNPNLCSNWTTPACPSSCPLEM